MEELECCECECNSKKSYIYVGMAIAGVSLLSLATYMIMRKLKTEE